MSTEGGTASVFVGVPCYGGQITDKCTMGLAALAGELRSRGIRHQLTTLGHKSIVEAARNDLVRTFLATEATHLLFIDADTEFRPEDVVAMLALGRGVVCGACAAKRYDWPRIHQAALAGASAADLPAHGATFCLEFDYSKGTPTTNADGSVMVAWNASDGCVPVLLAGTGFLMLERRVLLAVIEHERQKAARAKEALGRLLESVSMGKKRQAAEWAEAVSAQLRPGIAFADRGGPAHAVFECEVRNGHFYSEDYLLSERLREIGEPIWLYAPAQLGHVSGTQVFRKPLSSEFLIKFETGDAYRRALAAIEQGRPGDWHA